MGILQLDQTLQDLSLFLFNYTARPADGSLQIVWQSSSSENAVSSTDVSLAEESLFQQINANEAASFKALLLQDKPIGHCWELSFRNKKSERFEAKGKVTPNTDGWIHGVGMITPAGHHLHILEQSQSKLSSLNELHNLIINFSTLLVQSPTAEVPDAINTTLSRLGDYTQVDGV